MHFAETHTIKYALIIVPPHPCACGRAEQDVHTILKPPHLPFFYNRIVYHENESSGSNKPHGLRDQ